VSLQIFYGGTFDPVHNGHLAIARAARDALDAQVRLLPAADPPHKGPTHADAGQRARMLDLAVAGERGLKVDRRELRRAGPSYTIDTLGELRLELGPEAPIVWMIGSDSLGELHTWHRWSELFDYGHLLVVQRPGTQLDAAWVGAKAPELQAEIEPRWRDAAKLAFAPAGHLAVLPLAQQRPESSTELRRRIASGGDWRGRVPPAVAGYIDRHELYANPAATPASL
jgi:nicotinate-nucleotide adenylyltransferase